MSHRRPKGKVLRVTPNGIAKVERAIKKQLSRQEMAGMLQDNVGGLPGVERQRLLEDFTRSTHEGVDLGYIKTVLFPELYSYDIPQPMSNLSYCRFTDKQDAIISTGGVAQTGTTPAIGGSGMLIWYPKVTSGPSVFFYKGDGTKVLPTVQGIPFTSTGALDNTKWQAGCYQNYAQYFTQTALVSASISLQFVGQLEQECGLMVGGHIYGQGMNNLVIEDIEQSQFATKARPSEGLRFVYLPMEGTDYEFYPTTTNNSHNAGAQPTGNEQMFTVPWAYDGSNVATGFKKLDGSDAITFTATTNPYASLDSVLQYANNTQYVAIYWKGLPPGSDWLRIDVTRKFNGIPKLAYRDIVEMSRSTKNFDARKTFDVLRDLCVNAPVGGHTLKELDRTQDRIQQLLPNLVNPEIRDRIDRLQTLSDFAGALDQPTALGQNLVGQPTGMIERAYPF